MRLLIPRGGIPFNPDPQFPSDRTLKTTRRLHHPQPNLQWRAGCLHLSTRQATFLSHLPGQRLSLHHGFKRPPSRLDRGDRVQPYTATNARDQECSRSGDAALVIRPLERNHPGWWNCMYRIRVWYRVNRVYPLSGMVRCLGRLLHRSKIQLSGGHATRVFSTPSANLKSLGSEIQRGRFPL